GCNSSHEKFNAVSVEAGTRWLEAYHQVTGKNGRYVQGGGCTTVGAAGGFLQGGGFGSWSKKFGTAAANLLEVEVVTADGKILVANSCQNQDLFWALRGGGGGTFGVVTKATMRTHPLPKFFGWLNGTIKAKSDEAYRELIKQFLSFYYESLGNENWGEQVKIKGDNSLELSLAFQGLNEKDAKKIWRPFLTWIGKQSDKYVAETRFAVIPGRKMWDYQFIQTSFPSAIEIDKRLSQPQGQYWWAGGDAEQVSIFWYAYQSRWLPLRLFRQSEVKQLTDALFEGSRHWPIGIHFNKGQAGASPEAVRLGRETSINPELYKAAALVIIAAGGEGFPKLKGREPDLKVGHAQKQNVMAAMRPLLKLTEEAGTYSNEADYFEPNWKNSFWGVNYQKLLDIKKHYDPSSLFTCHHCVGSED
ncbi:MAG: FAD-binding protein, partial [Bdellovibrionales bacterium]|nr:FAD-binding protein [Bdellovibrionales bacterium]